MAHIYHVTTASALEAIKAEGLTPNTDRDATFDGYPVHGYLFACIRQEAADFYMSQVALVKEDEEIFLLRFPPGDLVLEQDPFGNGDDVRITGSIPPEAIEVSTPEGWVPLAGFEPDEPAAGHGR
jgi:hypothetical protein